ncbi:MAG: hypothetical protein ACK5LT_02035 [Lachnospirales bacterium]
MKYYIRYIYRFILIATLAFITSCSSAPEVIEKTTNKNSNEITEKVVSSNTKKHKRNLGIR